MQSPANASGDVGGGGGRGVCEEYEIAVRSNVHHHP